MKAPRYKGLRPGSARASFAAKGSSRKNNTRCELLLRKGLWHAGLRYRLNVADLPGRPDIVFRKAKVAVFVDGDFWHGRELNKRIQKLAKGHNAGYWVRKLKSNVARDSHINSILRNQGWSVLRYWESDIEREVSFLVPKIAGVVRKRLR